MIEDGPVELALNPGSIPSSSNLTRCASPSTAANLDGGSAGQEASASSGGLSGAAIVIIILAAVLVVVVLAVGAWCLMRKRGEMTLQAVPVSKQVSVSATSASATAIPNVPQAAMEMQETKL